MRPPAKTRKSVSALSPQVGIVLIWSGFSSVACTLISYGLVVSKHPQDALVRPLMHTSRFDRHGAVCAPLEPSAQLLDTTRRTVPPMAHGGLIGDANAFAAAEKPSAGVPILRIQDAPFAMAFVAHEQEVTPAEMCFSPMAANNLLKGLQRFAAR